jgi:hypothetical protein
MWDYIVLGQVPGTQIQVTFESWLISTSGLFTCLLGLLLIRAIRNNQLVLVMRISRVVESAAYTQWLATRRFIKV